MIRNVYTYTTKRMYRKKLYTTCYQRQLQSEPNAPILYETYLIVAKKNILERRKKAYSPASRAIWTSTMMYNPENNYIN
jgi:hypothetical protein